MNCRPGDLAIIVTADRYTPNKVLGTIVRVTELDPNGSPVTGMPSWKLDRLYAVDDFFFNRARDSILRSIRDPGADAVDEMVEKLGVAPKTLTEVREAEHG